VAGVVPCLSRQSPLLSRRVKRLCAKVASIHSISSLRRFLDVSLDALLELFQTTLHTASSLFLPAANPKYTDEHTKCVAIAACVRSIEKHGGMSDQAQATIEAIVDEAMNTEPTMVRYPYCLQWHSTQHVERGPLCS
jgi:hypothetical protein